MNCSYDTLSDRIRAAISRELHLADIPHNQDSIYTTVYGLAPDILGKCETLEYEDGPEDDRFDLLRTHPAPGGLVLWSAPIHHNTKEQQK